MAVLNLSVLPLASKGVEGLQKEGQCAILTSEIRAALRATALAKVFRTYHRRKKEGKHIRAAKCHFEAGTARLSAARISKPYPRKGTETKDLCVQLDRLSENFKTISPQGDGNRKHRALVNTYPQFQNHIPARGRKQFLLYKTTNNPIHNFKTISPQGDGNRQIGAS